MFFIVSNLDIGTKSLLGKKQHKSSMGENRAAILKNLIEMLYMELF